MKTEYILDNIAKIMARIMYYGDWKAETVNERVLEMLMNKLGYYPICEDDIITKLNIDDEIFAEAFAKNINGERSEEEMTDYDFTKDKTTYPPVLFVKGGIADNVKTNFDNQYIRRDVVEEAIRRMEWYASVCVAGEIPLPDAIINETIANADKD